MHIQKHSLFPFLYLSLSLREEVEGRDGRKIHTPSVLGIICVCELPPKDQKLLLVFLSVVLRSTVAVPKLCCCQHLRCLESRGSNHDSKALANQIARFQTYLKSEKYQGQISAQGILHLRNPNLGSNSGKRILGARILDPNSWVEFLSLSFPAKEAPRKIHPQEIHLSKFTFRNSTQKSGQKIHIAPLQGLLTEKIELQTVIQTVVGLAIQIMRFGIATKRRRFESLRTANCDSRNLT